MSLTEYANCEPNDELVLCADIFSSDLAIKAELNCFYNKISNQEKSAISISPEPPQQSPPSTQPK